MSKEEIAQQLEERSKEISRRRAEAQKHFLDNYCPSDFEDSDLQLSNQELLEKLQANFPLAQFDDQSMITMLEAHQFQFKCIGEMQFAWLLKEKH